MHDPQHGFVVGDRILGQAADSHPDWCVGFGQLGRFTCVGASAIGKYHLREARPRDDAFAVRAAGPWLAAVVADGAGSRPRSRYGASFAVEALCEHLLREAARLGPATPTPSPTPAADAPPPPDNPSGEATPPHSVMATGEALTIELAPADADWAKRASEAATLPLPGRDGAAPPAAGGSWVRPAAARPGTPPTAPAAPATATTAATPAAHAAPETGPAALPTAVPGPTAPQPGAFADFVAPVERPTARHATLAWRWAPPPRAFAAEPAAPPPDPAIAGSGLAGAVRRAFASAREGLEGFAASRDLALADLHCTLLGLVLNTATGELAVGQIGDGLIGALRRDGRAAPLVEPPETGQAGETYVVTQRDWEPYLGVAAHPAAATGDLAACFLMTDGVADDCSYPPPPDILDRWARDVDRELRADRPLPETAMRLLHWLANYEARGSWDDRTLIVIVRAADD